MRRFRVYAVRAVALLLVLGLSYAIPHAAPGLGDHTNEQMMVKEFAKLLATLAFASVTATLSGTLLFIITQDTTQAVSMTDIWTVAHAALLVFCLYALTKTRRKKRKTRPSIVDEPYGLELVDQTA